MSEVLTGKPKQKFAYTSGLVVNRNQRFIVHF